MTSSTKADAILAALRNPSALPEDMFMVPREPTEAMIEAYFETCRRHGFHAHINATAAWTAMISAHTGDKG